MSFGISEVLAASSVSAAAFVPAFDDEHDFLAISEGHRLFLYSFASGDLGSPVIHEFFARVIALVPLAHRYYMQSNLLVVFERFRGIVLSHDGACRRELSFPPSLDARMPDTFRFAIHPTCLAVFFTSNSVDIFPISSQSLLEASFPIQVSCKRIIDITFIGPVSKVVRLAVLAEQFNTAPCVHVFDIDIPNLRYEEDVRKKVTLPMDSYLIRTLSPESSSIAIVFSAQQAARVLFSAGITPIVTTATIFTPNRVLDIRHLGHDMHV